MKLRGISLSLAIACLAISTFNLPAIGQNEAPPSMGGRQESSKQANIIVGQPFLWEEPGDIEQRDLFYGRGGREGAPDPAGKYRFIRRSTTGTQKKIIVTDDRGREWTVKFGPEAKPETTASIIVAMLKIDPK